MSALCCCAVMLLFLSHFTCLHCTMRAHTFITYNRVLTQWHSEKAGEDDFLKWDPKMFTDFREEYGNVDVLICKLLLYDLTNFEIVVL